MKASTLFVISIAVLFSLGVVGVAKYVGFFKEKPAETKAKEEPILVLVANSDLYKDVAITSADVRVRELHPNEKGGYDQNPGDFLPPFVSAAHLRIPRSNIRADQALKRTQFYEEQPVKLTSRLNKAMRSVVVMVPKERCGGGLIQKDEYVDVWLTSKINDVADPNKTYVRTARLDRDCKVITKRNSLRILNQADADGSLISFGLEVNPYRAALIEFAQHKGQLTLVPVGLLDDDGNEKKDEGMGMEKKKMTSVSDMTSTEYRDEDLRVEAVKKGELVIGDGDLARIFKIEPPPTRTPPIRVVIIPGIYPSRQIIFGDARGFPDTTGTPQVAPLTNLPVGVSNFQNPNVASKDCPTCGKDPKATGTASSTGASFSPPR